MAGILDTINNAASRSGLDADYLARIAHIESGMNPNARTGSYKGLFQLSPTEFSRYGGRNIYDPADNANTAAAMMADQRNAFTAKYGRPPTPTEAYMVHQQGAGGLDAHLANPDRPAWQNMLSTGEGQQKGERWAKAAIWGNIPDTMKAQFGNVNNVTSDAFINQVWKPKVEGTGEGPPTGSPAGPVAQADAVPQATQTAAGESAGLPGQYGAQAPAASPSGGLLGSAMASLGVPSSVSSPVNALTGMAGRLGGSGSSAIPVVQTPPLQNLLPAPPPMQPGMMQQLQRPQIDYSGLQRLLSGQRGFA